MVCFLRRDVKTALAIAALAAVSLPIEAHAYCRTTTKELPASYSPTRGCYDEGLYLFWKNACVGYSINQAASTSIPFEDATRVIDAAFATWMRARCEDTGLAPGIAASNLGPSKCASVRYNSDGPNQNLIVFRDRDWPYNDKYNTLGLTTVTFNAETGEIYDADMEINASERNLSITDRVPARGFDLASVVTHEAGHFFGLAHATDGGSTMYASYKPGSVSLRTLAPDDVQGICAIYPDATTRTVSRSVSPNETVLADACDATPRHGFTTACSEPSTDGCTCSTEPRPASASMVVCGAVVVAAMRLLARRRPRTGPASPR